MKNEKALGLVGAIILIIFIVIAIISVTYFIKHNEKKEKNADIKANMLLIQGSCKVKKQKTILDKDNVLLIGTKLSEITDDDIINEFKELDIIDDETYNEYYVLSDENLEELDLDVKNETDSYYIVNYDTSEVIITKGYEGKYKLSEME